MCYSKVDNTILFSLSLELGGTHWEVQTRTEMDLYSMEHSKGAFFSLFDRLLLWELVFAYQRPPENVFGTQLDLFIQQKVVE